MKKFEDQVEKQRAALNDFERRLPSMTDAEARREFAELVNNGNAYALQQFLQFRNSKNIKISGMRWDRLDGVDVETNGGGNIQDWPGLPTPNKFPFLHNQPK